MKPAGTELWEQQTPLLSYMVHSSLSGEPLQDRMHRMIASLESDSVLRLRGKLAAGLYQMSLTTREDTFPVETLMVPLSEWPSGKTVQAGPFDFDHTSYRMVVPTFRVYVNDEDAGLVWCKVPSPENQDRRRIRAIWGIRVREGGLVDLCLEVPEIDAKRLRWSDLAEITLRIDDRRPVPLHDTEMDLQRRPRLFVKPGQFDALARERDGVQQALLDKIVAGLESGAEGTYMHRTALAALAGRITGERRWIDEALERTFKSCRQSTWGYHDQKDLMGWNNDRDAGMRMFEAAVVYDWLYDELTEDQRRIIREKLAYHADIAAKVTLLQKSYWYYRTNEAHGQGLWFGFTAAAAALLGEDERADDWLAWAHGNLRDALEYAPEDGITEWLVFNTQWLIYWTMLVERLRGKNLQGRYPYLRSFGRNIVKFAGHGSSIGPLLLFLAERFANRKMQADAIHACNLDPEGHELPAGSRRLPGGRTSRPRRRKRHGVRPPHPLALLAYDPDVEPSRPTRLPPAVCSQNGTAICRGKSSGAVLLFRSGTPLTARQHSAHNWMAQQWYRAMHAGSFAWYVGGRSLIPSAVPGYRQRTRDANLISVDGKGHPTEGRWLGYGIPLENTARIEHFATGSGVTFCQSNGSDAYIEQAGVIYQVRRWVFLHDLSLLVMHDVMEVSGPRSLAWHLHAQQPWQQNESRDWTIATAEEARPFTVRALATRIDGRREPLDAVRIRNEVSQFVPPYTLGANTYKTLDWQPELQKKKEIPKFYDLRIAPPDRTTQWELLTAMGPGQGLLDEATLVQSNGSLVTELGDAGAVSWSHTGEVQVTALDLKIEADVVVRVGPFDGKPHWVSFRTRSYQRGSEGQTLFEPDDLVWRAGETAPTPLKPGRLKV